MKPRLKSKKQLYIAMIIASFIIAAGVYFYFSSQLYPINILELRRASYPDQIHYKIFRDLNNDGFAEGITITLPSNNNSSNNLNNIQVFSDASIAEEQYNLGKYYSKETSLFCTDVNNDNYDDIIYFYYGADSVFLSVIDHKNRKFIVKKKLVYSKPKEARSGFDWVPVIKCIDTDIGNNGSKYLYFLITTGHAIFPRGIYKMNLSDFEIEKRFESGANLLPTISLCDVNGDGKNEILAISGASNNTPNLPYKLKYDDTVTHLFLFDGDLNILKHKIYDTGYGGTYFNLIDGEKEKKILISFRNLKEGGKYSLQLLNKDFKILKEKITQFESAFSPSITNNKILLPSVTNIGIFDLDLNLLSEIHFKLRVSNVIFNLKLDGSEYRLIVTDSEAILIDENLDIVAKRKLKLKVLNGIQPNPNTFKSRSFPGKKLILVRGLDEEALLSFEKNDFYSYMPLLFPSVFLLSFLSLFTTRRVYISLFKYHSIFKHVIPQSENGIIVINEFGEVAYINPTAEYLLNLEGENVKGKRFSEITIDSELKDFYGENSFSGESYEKIMTLKTGKETTKIKVIIHPLKSGLKSVIGHLITLNDLTRHLLRERSDILSHSIQKVAHEIKTPLSSILLNLDSVEEELSSHTDYFPKLKRDINVARNEIERIKKFTNNFLKFANVQEPNRQIINCGELIYSSLLKFESYILREINVVKEIEDNLYILGDPHQMEEVLQILIENAIDAMKGKGTLKIQLDKNKNSVCFKIVDYGPGVPDQIEKTIFDPYVTTKKEGTGMGLAIAKKILEDHGSSLRFKREDNATVFWFEMEIQATKEV